MALQDDGVERIDANRDRKIRLEIIAHDGTIVERLTVVIKSEDCPKLSSILNYAVWPTSTSLVFSEVP